MLHFEQGQDNVLLIPLENASSEFDYFAFVITNNSGYKIQDTDSPFVITLTKADDESEFPERISSFPITEGAFTTAFTQNGEYEFEFCIYDSTDGISTDVLLKKGKLIVHVNGQGFYTQPTDINFTFKQRS